MFPERDDLFDLLFSHSKFKTFQKKEILLSPGREVDTIFFIKDGLIRSYRIIDGNDITHHFHKENWFATDYQGFLTNSPCKLYFEAVTDCSVYVIKKDVLLSLYEMHHEIERLGRIIAEQAYLQMVERLKSIQTSDLKERYDLLIKKHPHIYKLVPQKHIATYLGVTPQSLSRIKSYKK